MGSWHKFCNLQNKTFFVQCPSSHFSGTCVLPCHSHRPSALGSRTGKIWMAHCSVHFTCPPPLPASMKVTPLYSFLPGGPFLSLSKLSSRKQAGRDSLPVWTAAGGLQLRRCGGRGKGKICACDSCKRSRRLPRSPDYSPSSCLSLLPGPGRRNPD